MGGVDATRNGNFGGPEDGVGRWGQLGPDPVFRLPGFQINHPDFGEVLQHGAGRQLIQLLLPANDTKECHLKTERQEADGDVSLDPILARQVHRSNPEGGLDLPERPLHLPQPFVGKCGILGGEIRVGPQDVDPAPG